MKVQYGWVIVAIGALMSCVSVGAMMSLAVFLQPITQATGWTRAGVSSAMTLNFLIMGAAGFAWGAVNDRFGTRPVVLAGAVLLGLGLVLASRAASQTQFLLAYGILVGLSAGSFFVPMMTAVSAWVPNQRSLAVSLVSAGVGVAPMTVSPFAAWLLTNGDWRAGRAHRVRHHGRPPRGEARADRRTLHPGARRRQLHVRESPRRVLRRRLGVRLRLRRRHAALRGAGARLLRAADYGHGAWRGGD